LEHLLVAVMAAHLELMALQQIQIAAAVVEEQGPVVQVLLSLEFLLYKIKLPFSPTRPHGMCQQV
jgi:hypothetical protein